MLAFTHSGWFSLNNLLAKGPSKSAEVVGTSLGYPDGYLMSLIEQFLSTQLNQDLPEGLRPGVMLTGDKLKVFGSATATFYAPSDRSGRHGMMTERIRATPNWRGEGLRNDTVFLSNGVDLPGMHGLRIARVRLLFSFQHDDLLYPCALVETFQTVGDAPDHNTGMWVVKPEIGTDGYPVTTVVRIDSILRAAHLMPIFGKDHIPIDFDRTATLDAFAGYYVNKFIDHHAHEFLH